MLLQYAMIHNDALSRTACFVPRPYYVNTNGYTMIMTQEMLPMCATNKGIELVDTGMHAPHAKALCTRRHRYACTARKGSLTLPPHHPPTPLFHTHALASSLPVFICSLFSLCSSYLVSRAPMRVLSLLTHTHPHARVRQRGFGSTARGNETLWYRLFTTRQLLLLCSAAFLALKCCNGTKTIPTYYYAYR